jgi:chromosome segregation ATPase
LAIIEGLTMQQNLPGIPADVRDRIITTAKALFEQSDGQAMPTVDQVRRAAKVDMNAASQVMREWRKSQMTQSTPVVVAIPDAVQQAATAAIAAIWTQAQELGNENLRNAQAAWDSERVELDAMRVELANAFEIQAGELEVVKAELDRAHEIGERQEKELAQAKESSLSAIANAEKMAVKLAELEKSVAALKQERDHADKTAQEAREKAAKLEGALEAIQEQNKALLDTLGRLDKAKK